MTYCNFYDIFIEKHMYAYNNNYYIDCFYSFCDIFGCSSYDGLNRMGIYIKCKKKNMFPHILDLNDTDTYCLRYHIKIIF